MLASDPARMCEFCDAPVLDYAHHLKYHHKMNCPDDKIVKCMFCLEPMSELDMFSHVFYGHNISGMFFSSAGAGTEVVATNTVSIQTEEKSVKLDQSQEEHGETDNNNNDEEEDNVGLNVSSNDTHDADVVENSAHEEENLILIDDESDFEMDPDPDPFPVEDLVPDERRETGGDEEDEESEVTLLKVTRSDPRPSENTPEPQVTLINMAAKSPAERVRKKVTFSDLTNYFPVKKRSRLKRREREPLILGANTSLKYLKYWGTTEKPDY